MSQGTYLKPSTINKTLLQQAKVAGFYAQYERNLSRPYEWVTILDFEIPQSILAQLHRQLKLFKGKLPHVRIQPAVCLRDLNYVPLAYLVAEGVIIYILPETYTVPSLHSKAKTLPDFEVGSVMNQLIKAIDGRDYAQMFESYHTAMLYGEFNFEDKLKSDYTRYEWIKLQEMFAVNPLIQSKLDTAINNMKQEGYTIQSVAKNISWFIEKELKDCLLKINSQGQL